MPSDTDWLVPKPLQPRGADYEFDLDRALTAVVALTSRAPEDAFSAQTLGTERVGHGVLIRDDGLVLTVGYLAMEAEEIWLTLHDGRVVPGHAVGFDYESGLCLVQALTHIKTPYLELGSSSELAVDEPVVIAGAGGRKRSVAAHIVSRQSFAGYWEYLIDKALLTAPTHPQWGGSAMINQAGELVGIASLQLEQDGDDGEPESLNLIIPIDVLKPVLDDLLKMGRPDRAPRPWLGCHAAEIEGRIVIIGVSKKSPARRADLRTGDMVLKVNGRPLRKLADFWRRLWACGPAGSEVTLTIFREDTQFDVQIRTGDRVKMLKQPRLH